MKVKVTKIGGQAVIEGVMMRGEKSVATAMRKPNGDIEVDSARLSVTENMRKVGKIPIIRGIVNFCNMLYVGTKTLMDSADIQGIEEEPSKFEKWLSEKFKIDVFTIALWIGVILGIALAVGLFFVLPQVFTSLIEMIPGAENMHFMLKNLIEGLIRILIFVLYIVLVSRMKEIKRVFRYHGAEHKTINCYESGQKLTIQNVKNCSRIHNRCGTTFLFIVMIVSILLFSLCGWDSRWWVRLLIRLALIPLVMGVSYEILKVMAKYDNFFVNFFRAPGLWLQRLTTAEPDEDMIQIAISAFKTVEKMDKDDTILGSKSGYLYDYDEVKDILSCRHGLGEYAEELDWIICNVLGCKRAELLSQNNITNDNLRQIERLFVRVKNGEPLDYALGESEFYGYKFIVNGNVLIPRPETELLVEQALRLINENDKVLDLCTGSGCIAITIAKEKNIKTYASDISSDCLNVAQKNAIQNEVEVEFILSNLFENIEEKFDIIVSNPPYIRSKDIQTLDNSVKNYEPKIALDGGESGFDIYDKILATLDKCLVEGGTILFECGYDQSTELKSKCEQCFNNVDIIKDYNNIDRIIIAKGYKNV